MDETSKRLPTTSKKKKRTSGEVRQITNFGLGIKGLKTALKWLKLTAKEKAMLDGILKSNQKQYQVYLGDTKPASNQNTTVLASLMSIKKAKRKDALDKYTAKLGLATPRSFDTVTNPRPLPGGGKKKHGSF